jgi:hypothetical protein
MSFPHLPDWLSAVRLLPVSEREYLLGVWENEGGRALTLGRVEPAPIADTMRCVPHPFTEKNP